MDKDQMNEIGQVDEARARQIDALARAMPKSVQPPEDLWPKIEAGLHGSESRIAPVRAWRSTWVQAAAAVLLVSVTATITTLVMREPQPETGETAAAGGSPAEVTMPLTDTVPADIGAAPDDSAVYWPRGLSGGIGSADYLAVNTLPEDTRKTFLDSLVEVQSARRAVEAALEEDPNNMWLRELWLHAYEQEMELLDDTNRVAHDMSGRLRT
jgi:hypothetical protein